MGKRRRLRERGSRVVAAAMKMLGLIGGLSWESSAEYYRLINRGVRNARGPTASARCLLWSFDFDEIVRLQRDGDWAALTERMIDAAKRLEGAGAEALLICSNTMHLVAKEVQAKVGVPLLHIVDPTADRIKAAGLRRVGLLGTAFTMEQAFYGDRLRGQGLEVTVPDAADRARVHAIIYDELVAGIVTPGSRAALGGVIARLVAQGAEGIILGCTELMLAVQPEDSAAPLFDTTTLHAGAAVAISLSD